MAKTVAVMNGLDEVSDALKRNGIEVVDVADTGTTISAIVYSAKAAASPTTGQHHDMSPSGGGVDDMVLMLNADELTVDEIVARVKSIW